MIDTLTKVEPDTIYHRGEKIVYTGLWRSKEKISPWYYLNSLELGEIYTVRAYAFPLIFLENPKGTVVHQALVSKQNAPSKIEDWI